MAKTKISKMINLWTKKLPKMKITLSLRITNMKMIDIELSRQWLSPIFSSTCSSISSQTVLTSSFICPSYWLMQMGYLCYWSFWIKDLRSFSLKKISSSIRSAHSYNSMRIMIWTLQLKKRFLSFWDWHTNSAETKKKESSLS